MGITAAVINAGLGDFSLGLEMAGIKVIAAYEPDKRAVTIHKANVDAPVYTLSSAEIDIKMFPQVDLLAARLYMSRFSHANHIAQEDCDPAAHILKEILTQRQPRAFFLLAGSSAKHNRRFREFLGEIAGDRYQIQWEAIDVAEALDVPVNEYMVCVVGNLRGAGRPVQFAEYEYSTPMQPEDCLQLGQSVDPWYFRLGPDDVPQYEDAHRFFCWKRNVYAGTDEIQWNHWKIPLIRDVDRFRKVTHREIANLKGFPAKYALPGGNKQWLYQKLMYAGNIFVIKQVAEMIRHTLTDNPWRSQKWERGQRFESLFGRYLMDLANKKSIDPSAIERDSRNGRQIVDFIFRQESGDLYFEVKHHNGRFAPKSSIEAACERYSSLKISGTLILVFANEVPEQIKSQYLEKFGFFIWDVSNLPGFLMSFQILKMSLLRPWIIQSITLILSRQCPTYFRRFLRVDRKKKGQIGERNYRKLLRARSSSNSMNPSARRF